MEERPSDGPLLQIPLPAMLGAEVDGLAIALEGESLVAVDLHPTDRVRDAAAHGQSEERDEDERRDQVEEELVVDLDRPEDVVAGGPGPVGISPTAPKTRSIARAASTIVTNISAVMRIAKARP